MYMPKQRTWTEEQLRLAVAESFSIRKCLQILNLKPAGGNYKQIHKYIHEFALDTSHWKGQGWSKGVRITCYPGRLLEDILVENSDYMNTSHLRTRLLKAKIFEHKCYSCQGKMWLGNPIPLELEHINGTNSDNRLENLTLLCPNCHAFTSTYRGKNKGKTMSA